MMQGSNIEMTGTDQASVTDTAASSDVDGEVPLDRVEAGVSVPDAETMRASVTPYRKSYKVYGYIFCGTIVLLAVVIGLAVGLQKDGDGRSSSSSANSAVPRKANATEFIDFFASQGVSDRTAMDDTSSPQGLAIEWLSERDGRNLPIPTGNLMSEDGYELLERYVLAVVYYSFNGPFWATQSRFLGDADVCGWGFPIFTGTAFFDFGVVCTEVGTTQRMTSLYLDRNNLVGSIPSELGMLTTLQTLDFNSNAGLVGSIPTQICKLINLETLALGFGGLYGAIPDCIGDLGGLEVLFLSNNELSGAIPPSVSTLNLLRGLFVDDNKLTGDITTMFNNMPDLTRLYIEDNEFTGNLDDSFLAGHANIQAIDLSTNKISGTVPGHFLSSLTSLIVLDLHANQLGGPLPSDIPSGNHSLAFVALHQNNITGAIPSSFSNLENLVHLDFSSNMHTGVIPTELGLIKDLRYLFIADNQGLTSGPIPTELATLSNLEELNLKSTNRDGSLPEFISSFRNLTLLDLDENEFVGDLPTSYGNLTNLEFLLLNRNSGISGTVPTQYSSMTSLRVLLLDNTAVTGTMEPFCSIPSLNEASGDGDGDELVVANCGGTSPLITNCTCCDLCCAGGEDCHDNFLVASLDPVWERGFRRAILDFGNDTRFISRDFLSPNA